MTWGAVIIGGPIGPNMIRPFTLLDFREFERECLSRLLIRSPYEVAYPSSLEESKLSYREGILADVYAGKNLTPKEFESEVSQRLIEAGKLCEKLWCESGGRKFTSDLGHHKVLWSDGTTNKAIMEVLETYEDDSKIRYFEIASDLLRKTKDARIKRYNEQQQWRYEESLSTLSKYCFEKQS